MNVEEIIEVKKNDATSKEFIKDSSKLGEKKGNNKDENNNIKIIDDLFILKEKI